jgi:hypothetical protein
LFGNEILVNDDGLSIVGSANPQLQNTQDWLFLLKNKVRVEGIKILACQALSGLSTQC